MEFSKEEQRIIDRTAKHYSNIDVSRAIVDNNVNETLSELGDFIDKNYALFLKDMNKVLRAYAGKMLKKSMPEFDKSMDEGLNFIREIL